MSVSNRETADWATIGGNRSAVVVAEVTPTCTGSKAGHLMMHVDHTIPYHADKQKKVLFSFLVALMRVEDSMQALKLHHLLSYVI